MFFKVHTLIWGANKNFIAKKCHYVQIKITTMRIIFRAAQVAWSIVVLHFKPLYKLMSDPPTPTLGQPLISPRSLS